MHVTNEISSFYFCHTFLNVHWQLCAEGQHEEANSCSLSLLQYTMFMCCAILITIVQYCNFCQLSSWMRSLLATVVGAVLLILLYVSLCPDR